MLLAGLLDKTCSTSCRFSWRKGYILDIGKTRKYSSLLLTKCPSFFVICPNAFWSPPKEKKMRMICGMQLLFLRLTKGIWRSKENSKLGESVVFWTFPYLILTCASFDDLFGCYCAGVVLIY